MRLRILLLTCGLALCASATAAAYPWPLKPFHKQHPIRANFGDPRTRFLNTMLTDGLQGPGTFLFHNGIDIAAPKYTPIRAASAGKVVTVGRPYLAYGDTAVVVIIAHGFNFSTLYGHLDDLHWPIVSVGQTVSAGQIIAYVGMTGWTTGPHLHFMTILNGRAVNPMGYLP